MKTRTRMQPCTALWHPSLEKERKLKDSVESHILFVSMEEVSNPCVALALDNISRDLGNQDGVPDCIEYSRYV